MRAAGAELAALNKKYYGVVPKSKLDALYARFPGLTEEELIAEAEAIPEAEKEAAKQRAILEKVQKEAARQASARRDRAQAGISEKVYSRIERAYELLVQQGGSDGKPDGKTITFHRSPHFGRWAIVRTEESIYHSDSTNPSSEKSCIFKVYDLLEFQGGTLFSEKHTKHYSMWRSRGGASGSIGVVAFVEDSESDGWDTIEISENAGYSHSGSEKIVLEGKDTVRNVRALSGQELFQSCMSTGSGRID